MITSLHIERFKCFEDQIIKLGNLTILAGGNATGKSTVIQIILMLWQSFAAGTIKQDDLLLSGDLVNIGTVLDAFKASSSGETMRFDVYDDSFPDPLVPLDFEFEYPKNPEGASSMSRIGKVNPLEKKLFKRQLIYFSAERIGPRLLYQVQDSRHKRLNFGTHGEYAVNYLVDYQNDPIPNKKLSYPGEKSLSLRYQAELWMRKIVPDVAFDLQKITQADQARLGIKNTNTNLYLRPTNIGFGISYTLPIVVASLMAPKGSLLLVENPEAHLHPAGQSEMGKFLARVAATGVQVIVETHSDHLLNGVRLAAKNLLIEHKKIQLQFFSQGENGIVVDSPTLQENSSISFWPKGFFDQFQKDLLELM